MSRAYRSVAIGARRPCPPDVRRLTVPWAVPTLGRSQATSPDATHRALTTLLALIAFAAVRAEPVFLDSGAVLPTDLPFSEAVRVGDTVYLSGQIGVAPGTLELVPGGIAAEARQTMDNIRTTLEAHGLSLRDVVKCTVMLEDIGEWGAFNEVYGTYFETGRYPARSAFGTDGLALGARVEVECLAVLPRAPGAEEPVPQDERAPEPATEPEAVAVPFVLPQPEGWNAETIPFPLPFAPTLPYRGLEVLRFAPGMFDAQAEDFWTYAFVWWIDASHRIDGPRLAHDLEAYFAGLARLVAASAEDGESVSLAMDPDATVVALEAAGPDAFTGTVRTVDAFTTGASLALGLRVTRRHCEAAGRQAMLFLLSPQAPEHPLWTVLEGISRGFRCDEA